MKTRFSLLSVVVCLFTWSSNVAAQSGWPNVGDPSKLKFGVACKVTQVLFGRETEVFGFLATGIDLSQDDATAKLILERAVDFAVDRCAEPYEFLGRIKVTIRHVDVDPTTISEDKFKGLTYTKLNDLLVREYPLVAVQGLKAQTFSGRSDLQWIEYRNLDRERRNESEKEKERAERAEAERVQQALQAARREAERVQRARQAEQQAEAERLAKQKEQADIAARSAAFVKAYAVTHFVTMAQLAANPFVYQGQVVAVYAPFDQMNSATEGVFLLGSDALLVSAIPSGRFTQARSMVMLAGRVLGKQEIKLPILGPTLVPHLSFVGSAFCQKQNCLDYAIYLK